MSVSDWQQTKAAFVRGLANHATLLAEEEERPLDSFVADLEQIKAMVQMLIDSAQHVLEHSTIADPNERV
jgi:hypothetical protein